MRRELGADPRRAPRARSTRCSCCAATASTASTRSALERERRRDAARPAHADLPACARCRGASASAAPRGAARLRLEGAALAAAQLLGIAEMTQELAIDYAKKREQFDRPIGGFQAIKHICADMFVRQEIARAAVYAAGATLDDPAVGDLERAVAGAKIDRRRRAR